jgi:hypothetical protein
MYHNYLSLISLLLQGTILMVFQCNISRALSKAKLPMDRYTIYSFLVLFIMLALNIVTAPTYICNIIDEVTTSESYKEWYSREMGLL